MILLKINPKAIYVLFYNTNEERLFQLPRRHICYDYTDGVVLRSASIITLAENRFVYDVIRYQGVYIRSFCFVSIRFAYCISLIVGFERSLFINLLCFDICAKRHQHHLQLLCDEL